MERTKLQQAELDKIEKHILIMIFGQEDIPNPAAEIMTALNINPNDYVKKMENKLIPVMKENGDIDGPKGKLMDYFFFVMNNKK